MFRRYRSHRISLRVARESSALARLVDASSHGSADLERLAVAFRESATRGLDAQQPVAIDRATERFRACLRHFLERVGPSDEAKARLARDVRRIAASELEGLWQAQPAAVSP